MICFARRSIVAAASATLFATAAWAASAPATSDGRMPEAGMRAAATAPLTGWERSKYVWASNPRPAYSRARLTVYDAQWNLQERFDYHIASDQTGPDGWPRMMARIINARSKLVRIGALQGKDIVPVATAGGNRVYLQPGVQVEGLLWDQAPGYVPSGDFDFQYPDGIGGYKPGVTVVRADDGARYGCRPFPAGAWCNIKHDDYRPGIGNAWQQAWVAMEEA